MTGQKFRAFLQSVSIGTQNWLCLRVLLHKMSIGVEECPPIGVQKGPLWRCGEQARGGAAFQLAQPTRACVSDGVQARVLMRQLSLPGCRGTSG